MIAKRNPLMRRISVVAEMGVFFLLLVVGDWFRRRPRPSGAPLVSGIAPCDDGSTRPLSETQLRKLEAWLLLHREGWRRNIIPPVSPSYMVQVEHSDRNTTFVLLFSGMRSAVYFRKHGKDRRLDAGWLHPPTTEVDSLIALLKKEA
jgi:hypothetical protein